MSGLHNPAKHLNASVEPKLGWDKIPVEIRQIIIKSYIAAVLSDLHPKPSELLNFIDSSSILNSGKASARIARLAKVGYSFGHGICLAQLENALTSLENSLSHLPPDPVRRIFALFYAVPAATRVAMQVPLTRKHILRQMNLLIPTIQALKAQAVRGIPCITMLY